MNIWKINKYLFLILLHIFGAISHHSLVAIQEMHFYLFIYIWSWLVLIFVVVNNKICIILLISALQSLFHDYYCFNRLWQMSLNIRTFQSISIFRYLKQFFSRVLSKYKKNCLAPRLYDTLVGSSAWNTKLGQKKNTVLTAICEMACKQWHSIWCA